MHRIDTAGAVGGQFSPGNPGAGVMPTILSADWCNDVQEQLVGVILSAGIALVKGEGGQLLEAIELLTDAARAAAEATASADATAKANAALAAAKAFAWSPGDVKTRALGTVEAGWYECDGSLKNIATDAALYAAIGVTYGGDGVTTFRVPDYRGEFQRGWDHGRGVDAGRALGSSQDDAMQGHVHPIANAPQIGSGFGYSGSTGVSGAIISATGVPQGDGINGTPRTAPETRPRNIAVMYVIKR